MICAPEPMISALAVGRICAAQSNALINCYIIPDLSSLADDRKAVVDKEIGANLCAWMDVDRGQKAREMIDHTRQKMELCLE